MFKLAFQVCLPGYIKKYTLLCENCKSMFLFNTSFSSVDERSQDTFIGRADFLSFSNEICSEQA